MIRYVTGDLLKSGTEALVNPVNCVGVMGKGLALSFKEGFPMNFKAYEMACQQEAVRPGRMFVFETRAMLPQVIFNFPTKRHWKDSSRLDDIASGLADLAVELRSRPIRSVAVPSLGCGNGGLDWGVVRPLIESELGRLTNTSVWVYTPDGTVNCSGCQHVRSDGERTYSSAGKCCALESCPEVEMNRPRYCCLHEMLKEVH